MSKRSPGRANRLLAGPLLLAFFAVGCGSSAYERRTGADRLLSARVDESLAASSALSGLKVEGRSHYGVVALLGEVPDDGLSRHAEQLASEVPGVVRVNNMILVVSGSSRAAESAPARGAMFIARAD